MLFDMTLEKGKQGREVEALGKILKVHLFQVREIPYLNREGTTKNDTLVLFLKIAGALTPRNPLVGAW